MYQSCPGSLWSQSFIFDMRTVALEVWILSESFWCADIWAFWAGISFVDVVLGLGSMECYSVFYVNPLDLAYQRIPVK